MKDNTEVLNAHLDHETILLMTADFLHINNCHEALRGLEGELRQIICSGRLIRDLSFIKASLLDG